MVQVRQRGFTIVELAILMAVIMAMSAFAAEGIWGAVRTSRINGAAAKVLSDIRVAQQLARTHNSWYGIRFLAAPSNQYAVYRTDGSTDTTIANPANPGQSLAVDVRAMFGGGTISGVNIGGGNQVEFDPTGAPATDKNGAALTADGTVTLSLGGTVRTITIIKNTGRAE
jgi:Tfp pilus assembly protein FimT